MGVFNQNSKNVVEKMKTEIGKTFDVHDHMSGVTVDILLGKTDKILLCEYSMNAVIFSISPNKLLSQQILK